MAAEAGRRCGAGGWFRFGFLLAEGDSWSPSVALGPEPLLRGEEEEAAAGAGRRVLAVRPTWSFLALLLGPPPSPSLELRGGAFSRGRGLLPGGLPGKCLEALPSESHVLLLREDALEAWTVPHGGGGGRGGREGAAPEEEEKPLWRREIPQGEDPAAVARGLPLFPGGFVAPRPPFFWPLRGSLRAERLALGFEHALLLLAPSSGGGLLSWGQGRHGQLGHGSLESLAEPRPLEALQGLPVEEVAAGGWHSAALTGASAGGDLYLWGWNEAGQLALPSKTVAAAAESQTSRAEDEARTGDAENRSPDPLDAAFISIQAFPALLDLPDGAEVRKVSCGSRHTAALTRIGELYTWGWGQYGQLGHGDTASSDRPRKVSCFADWDLCVVDVTCGPWATYAQTERRTVDLRLAQPEA